ncbi:hypothetical protein MMC28_007640 [Mycoblastus sanguinarius]|nr:hypothetical protein [Mycoblastus sanguinarius]
MTGVEVGQDAFSMWQKNKPTQEGAPTNYKFIVHPTSHPLLTLEAIFNKVSRAPNPRLGPGWWWRTRHSRTNAVDLGYANSTMTPPYCRTNAADHGYVDTRASSVIPALCIVAKTGGKTPVLYTWWIMADPPGRTRLKGTAQMMSYNNPLIWKSPIFSFNNSSYPRKVLSQTSKRSYQHNQLSALQEPSRIPPKFQKRTNAALYTI